MDPLPLFRALDALTIDDGGGRAGLPLGLLSTLHIKCVVNILQCAVVGPQVEIVVDRALGRKVLGHRAPLAPRAQHIHDPPQSLLAKLASPIYNFAHIDLALVAAMFGRGYQRFDMRPYPAS